MFSASLDLTGLIVKPQFRDTEDVRFQVDPFLLARDFPPTIEVAATPVAE